MVEYCSLRTMQDQRATGQRALVMHTHLSGPPTMPDTVEKQGKQLSRARILMADDNAAILDHVSDILQADYEIIAKVVDGGCVCDEVARLNPDLIVLDISMGECSGIEIARRLREQGYAGEIVFLTVHEDPAFVSAAIGAGGRGYVIKPRMNIDLGLAVKAVLSQQIFISRPLQREW
jgi:DNA-binding NarL/FixJ family response regulator